MTAASCSREPYEWALDALPELDEEGTPIEDPLPVISLQACTGNAFHGNRLLEWRTIKTITPPVERDPVEEMIESGLQLNGDRTSWPTCRLADDWDFDAIEEQAQRLTGHDHSGVRFESIRQVVWAAISDLEDAIRVRHGAIATSAVALFWESYQVHRHVMQFCHELEATETARTLRVSSDDCIKAGLLARRWLNTYARQLPVHVAAEGRVPQADQAAAEEPSVPELVNKGVEPAENGTGGISAVQQTESAMVPVHLHVAIYIAQPAEPATEAPAVDLSAELPALAAEGALMDRDKAVDAGAVEVGPQEPTGAANWPAAEVAIDEEVDPGRAERKQALQNFKAKGLRYDISITQPKLANKVKPSWNDRTMIGWWLRCDPRCKPYHDRLIRAVLAKDPRELWPKSSESKLPPN